MSHIDRDKEEYLRLIFLIHLLDTIEIKDGDYDEHMIIAIAIAVDQMGHDQRGPEEGQPAGVHTQEMLQPPAGAPPAAQMAPGPVVGAPIATGEFFALSLRSWTFPS